MEYVKKGLMTVGLLFVAGTLIHAVQSDAGPNAEKLPMNDNNPVSGYNVYAIDIPENVNFAGESVPLTDPDVRERMDRELLVNMYWQSNGLLMIKRANKYFPVIEPILKKYGVPDDFKYLAVIESGLMNVVSPAKATGFWQIMEGTGKQYGLEINANVDERYHLEKSTEVACKYLLDAKERMGTWTLAAAAYNAGQAGINRQLTRQKEKEYYDILLGEETGRYLFRIMAMKEIMSNPRKYGFNYEQHHLYKRIPAKKIEIVLRLLTWLILLNRRELIIKY